MEGRYSDLLVIGSIDILGPTDPFIRGWKVVRFLLFLGRGHSRRGSNATHLTISNIGGVMTRVVGHHASRPQPTRIECLSLILVKKSHPEVIIFNDFGTLK